MVLPAILGAYKVGSVAKHLWESSKHPRDENGKFISTGRLSFRVSPRSATVMYGHTVPIVPGKVNLYVGGLARVERAGGYQFAVEKKIRAAGGRAVARIPHDKLRTFIQHGGVETGSGTKITFSKPKIRQPTVRSTHRYGTKRISTKVGSPPSSVKGITDSSIPRAVRSPNRKPRTRSLPKSVASPPKAVAKAKGRKVK